MSLGSSIIAFYSGQDSDDRGRFLADLQTWPDDALESSHDFIQWMFPLRERSGVNPGAPVLDDAIIQEFRSRPELQESLRVSWKRMLRFYGFEFAVETIAGPMEVRRGPEFAESSANWLRPWNHNFLRITRILKSLSLLGLEREANAFFERLSQIYQENPVISAETFRFWQSSVSKAKRAG